MTPEQFAEILKQGGLAVVCVLLFFMWKIERRDRIEAQTDAQNQREKRIGDVEKQATALHALGESSRTETRALRRLIRSRFRSITGEVDDSDSDEVK